jgi:hypothetical protein
MMYVCVLDRFFITYVYYYVNTSRTANTKLRAHIVNPISFQAYNGTFVCVRVCEQI